METSRNRNTLTLFLCLLPCILAVLLVGIYALGIFSALSLTVVNILCIPFALLELAVGFIEYINRRKAYFFASSMIICALASYINVQMDGSEMITLMGLPMWAKAWLIALLVSIAAFLVILIRLFRWTQEDWENAKGISRRLRMEKKETWARQSIAKQNHRVDLSEQKHTHQAESAEQRYTHKIEIQTAKEEHIRQKQRKNYNESQTVWARIRRFISNTPNWVWNVVKALVLVAIIVLFFLFPVFQFQLPGGRPWMENVQELMKSLLGNRIKTPMDALFYYAILYFLAICVVGGVFSILSRIFAHNPQRKNSIGAALSDKYGAPAAILIVAGMMLALILGGVDLFDGITNIWMTLFMVIMFILVCLTAVELVRLTLAQCLLPDSLLNKLLRLIFVVTLEFFADFILSVVTKFRIQSLISSLFYLVFPEQNEKLQKRIDSILNTLVFKELDDIADNPNGGSRNPNGGFRKFWRTRTWRRRK